MGIYHMTQGQQEALGPEHQGTILLEEYYFVDVLRSHI